MATRSILTHQPEVECDVCGRRLLRGERPDAFLDAGQRRIVCELCIPRALGSGWMRESEALAAASAPRGRAARSLMGRLRQRRVPQRGAAGGAEDAAMQALGGEMEDQWAGGQPYVDDDREEPYSGAYAGPDESGLRLGEALERAEPGEGHEHAAGDEVADRQAFRGDAPAAAGSRKSRFSTHGSSRADASEGVTNGGAGAGAGVDTAALGLFNASEAAARIAGIARALGEPAVTVRPFEGSGGDRISIVVAWELCWYRYEVDLRGDAATVSLTAEGMELDELPGEDRVGNARADERGEVSLVS